ncbi:G-D-S-L family lipolytic protein [Nonlabens sp.]|uniref:G-D-S-L family lipolytic protein n=1 Tax=Nonlabens sp. TaxID=1888209 RepID=UPI001BCFA191|nr:G-D-S-L family lipolytic protein [Nonlabens sp.]
MKKLNIKLIPLFIASIAILSCEEDFDNDIQDGGVYTAGEADFSKYVTVGNSLTAGYADGSLYLNGQLNSYPNIIAGQMQFAGGGEFNQPLVNDNTGGMLANGVQILPNRLVLASDGMGAPAGPARYTGAAPTTDIINKVTGPLNNFGVPGARVFHLAAPGYGSLSGVNTGTANPYYARFSSSETSTVIGDATAANATFFTLWIGNNDILGYATSGGAGVDNNELNIVDPAMQGENSITNNLVFGGVYQQLVAGLMANGAKGALVNIPDVTSIPYFTTVPPNPIPLDGPTAAFVNSNYAQYNGGLQLAAANGLITATEAAQRTINFSAGQNFVVMVDNDLTDISGSPIPLPNWRQTTSNDLIVFTAAGVLGTLADPSNPASVIGVGVPLTNQQVLTTTEQARVTNAQQSYNATIEALAAANGLAYVDARASLSQVATTGVPFNGGLLTSTYATGGGFSLDGVHPTARGYAFTANVIIDAINAQYGATLPKVDIGAYSTIQLSDTVQ